MKLERRLYAHRTLNSSGSGGWTQTSLMRMHNTWLCRAGMRFRASHNDTKPLFQLSCPRTIRGSDTHSNQPPTNEQLPAVMPSLMDCSGTTTSIKSLSRIFQTQTFCCMLMCFANCTKKFWRNSPNVMLSLKATSSRKLFLKSVRSLDSMDRTH